MNTPDWHDLSHIPKIFELSDKEERQKRIDTCESCSFLTMLKTCSKCNCFMPVKTWLKAKKCPIGKW